MIQKSDNKFGSTFDRCMSDPEFKKEYDRELKAFAMSELRLALLDGDAEPNSIKKLAEMADVSPDGIQDLKSGMFKY